MAYRNRTPFQRFLASPAGLIISIIVCIMLGRAVYNIHAKASASSLKLSQAETELSRLQAQHDHLTKTVQYLSTDQGLEDEMRTKYRALREGESVAVIVDAPGSTKASASSTPDMTKDPSWWKSLLDLFGL